MKRSLSSLLTALAVLGALVMAAPAAVADHTAFADGDVFVSAGPNSVLWRHADGSANRSLTPSAPVPHPKGLALDGAGKLYVAGYTSNVVARFSDTGAANGTFGSGYVSHPTSIAFDNDGRAYVGLANGTRDVVRLSAAGAPTASYNVATDGTNGVSALSLAGDGCTLLYTSSGDSVKRFDVCSGSQAANLATGVPGSAAEGVAALPDGGALVAGTQSVVRLASDGSVASTFDAAGRDCWTQVALAAANGEFWAADSCASQVVRFDESGAVLGSFGTGTGSGTIGGLAVKGGGWTIEQGPSADLSVAQSDQPDAASSDNDLLYRVTVSNAGPDDAGSVVLSDVVSAGTIRSARGTGWTCAVSGAEAVCTLDAGTLPAGSTAAPIDVVVHTPESSSGFTLENTATVASDATDPQPANDQSTETTTVGPATSGTATAYIPPEGGQVTTATGPCADAEDHTCGTAIFPAGPGGIASLVEYPGGLAVCAAIGPVCAGDAVDVIVPDGYLDPANPIVFRLIYDETLALDGAPALIEKIVNGAPVTLPATPCPEGGPTGVMPCQAGQFRDGNNDLVYEFHFLSGDPKFQGIIPE